MPWETLINKLEATIIEVVNSSLSSPKSNKSWFSSWDSRMESNWFGLTTPSFVVKGGETSIKERDLIIQTLPKEG